MSIDTLPEQTSTPDSFTAAVRVFLTSGVHQVDDAIGAAERHIADLDTRQADLDARHAAATLELNIERVAADKHLAELVRSREQLLGIVGKDDSREQGEPSLPTHVCGCGRIAVVDPVLGPVHQGDGTHLPAMGACQMPPLGFLPAPGRPAGGEAPGA